MPANTKLIEKNILELEKRFRDGATILEAIDGVMSESTYHEHRKNNSEFAARMELAKEYVTEIARGVVAKRIKKGDVDTSKWWLERRNKTQFSTRTEQDIRVKELPKPIMDLSDVRPNDGDTQNKTIE